MRWRTRFKNAWDGFGWCARTVREAAILQAARTAGIGCPKVVALGEAGQHAFVLLSDESARPELGTLLKNLHQPQDRSRLAEALGRQLGLLHDAGFAHPDLFAKHILVSTEMDRYCFCLLDWQRAARYRRVGWRTRLRDLAALDATLNTGLASERLRLRALRVYWRGCACANKPPLGSIARQIRRFAERMQRLRSVRDAAQMPIVPQSQQFVPTCGGRVLVVRSFYEELGKRSGISLSKELQMTTWPAAPNLREIPELGHTLFRLQRFGVAAPRLCAAGFGDEKAWVLARAPVCMPIAAALAQAAPALRSGLLQQAGALIRGMHEAEYVLPAGDAWETRLGVVARTGAVVLAQVEPLENAGDCWQESAVADLSCQATALSDVDCLRFLAGYVQGGSGPRAAAWIRTVLLRQKRVANR